MAQRFLSIKNFEKYQSYKHRNPPWFKIHKSMFGDREFVKLPSSSRFLYVGLIYLAVESDNKVYNDRTWIAQRLYIDRTEIDLTPLYKAGFLQTTNVRRECSETVQDRDSTETVQSAMQPTPKRVSKPLTEWPEGFQFNEKHQAIAEGLGLNVHAEFIKFKDKALSKGWTYKDWDAGFRTWLHTSSDFKQARTR